MSPHGASFLGTKRPREEHENADHHQQQAVEYPPSANNVVAGEKPNSPGFKQDGFNIHRGSSFNDNEEVEDIIERLAREDSLAAKLRSTSPGLGERDGDELLGPAGHGHNGDRAAAAAAAGECVGHGHGQGELAAPSGEHVTAPDANVNVNATPARHKRVDSLGGDVDITLSPGELGGSQYIMSPGDHLASTLQRSQSTMSDVHSAHPPSSVEEVAAEQLRASQRLFPIFVKGRKVVHLVRHGQSTYNEAINGPGSWDEPNIFDAPLTKLGVNQAKSLGAFLAKLPKETVWVTSALTRAMETCMYGYKSSLEVKQMQKRKGAAVREAAGGGAAGAGAGQGQAGAGGSTARGKSRLSHGTAGGPIGGGPGGGNGGGGGGGGAGVAARASDENGYMDGGTPMVGTTPGGPGYTPMTTGGEASGSGAHVGGDHHQQQHHYDEKTPAPMSGAGGTRPGPSCLDVGGCGELAADAVGASPSEATELDGAEMSAWGDKVVVHQHLQEKLSTSGDIGRCKGVLMNEFPLLALGLSRLPGDVWWYSQSNRPNDAEREQFGSHEPSEKFRERVDKFRHWLMSREDKVFVVFGHSTFFKELTKGHRSLKNCEVYTYHL